jgi:hypothetical protein
MIKIRRLEAKDKEIIKKLHESYYNEFELPNFYNGFLSQFAIVDENDDIIVAGGVRPIAESIIVTDQTMSRIKIGRALVEAHRASLYTCAINKIDELHAFVTNEQYASHLIRHGFTPRSPALSMKV